MSLPDGLDALTWVGLTGQALFLLRVGLQWIASERAGESVVPPAYWWISAVAAVLVLVYAASTRDPVFVLGPLVNLFVYGRNLALAGRARAGRPARVEALWPVAAGLGTAAAIWLVSVALERSALEVTVGPVWLAVGLAGVAVWMARHLAQWWISERVGRSVLPAAYWWLSIAGSALLLAYAVHRVDWVFMLAYVLAPIPYVRNLVLLRRTGRAGGAPELGAA